MQFSTFICPNLALFSVDRYIYLLLVLPSPQSDEWTSTQNDLLDSIYSLDNDFFNDLDNLEDIKMGDSFLQPLTNDTTPTSPLSSTAESDFDIDRKPSMSYNDLLSNPDLNYMSSSASDSGLSSDNVDM